PADPDDVDRVHGRRRAVGALDRRGLGDAERNGRGRVRGHARRHAVRALVDAGVLLARAPRDRRAPRAAPRALRGKRAARDTGGAKLTRGVEAMRKLILSLVPLVVAGCAVGLDARPPEPFAAEIVNAGALRFAATSDEAEWGR